MDKRFVHRINIPALGATFLPILGQQSSTDNGNGADLGEMIFEQKRMGKHGRIIVRVNSSRSGLDIGRQGRRVRAWFMGC
jgi:hypothetical protein